MAPSSIKNQSLSGITAIVTGSTSGLGEGIARRLAKDGASVMISGRREDQGQRVTESINQSGGRAFFCKTDLSEEADCVNLIHSTIARFGRLDLLVNNAAIFPNEPNGTQPVDMWDEVFVVNVRAPFVLCREAIPYLRKQGGGRIINIGSTVPFIGKMNRLAYGSSKGALLTMTKMMARDLVQDHILVNWVAVGWVITEGEIELRNKAYGDGPAYLEAAGRDAPLGRLETVDEIAAGVAYLASPDASHVTGCELNISGGKWI